MEMLKRISAFLLALVWALALSACGGPETAGTLPPAAPGAAQPETSAQPPETDPPAGTEEPPEESSEPPAAGPSENQGPSVSEDGSYNSKEEVALYIHLYRRLPGNYVTKREAQDLGWSGGSVERYAGEGAAIGGSRFGNYEGLLPAREGRIYTECDIDTVGTDSRGPKRIVFSNDGLIYYTQDHYNSFELLYGEPE